MDLNSLGLSKAYAEGEVLEHWHPSTGAKLGLTVRVRGYDTPEVEEAGRDAMRTIMQASKKPDQAAVTRARTVAMAQAAVTELLDGFTGSVTTLAEYRAFLAEHEDGKFFVEQIQQFGGDRGSFFKSAGTP